MATDTQPKGHAIIERSTTLLFVATLFVILIGGIVEIVPLFKIEETVRPVEGMRPYSPLEQIGRNVYTREGCYVCHSQQIRPFRDEVERYGHFSVAAESMYDHPFLWGSKRTGPDLARVGSKYSNAWHLAHMQDPRSVVPVSLMPSYAFLENNEVDVDGFAAHMEALRTVGVPYSDEMIAQSAADIRAQASGTDTAGLLSRYPKARLGDFDDQPQRVTEMDAVIAYLQVLGTLAELPPIDLQGDD